MKEYRVWFEQVNQSMFDVAAEDKNEAIKKAAKEWRRDCGHPQNPYTVEWDKENNCEKED